MPLHVGINGFGRLGRVFFRASIDYDELEVTAINDPTIDLNYLCYLIKFDSTHGHFKGNVEKTDNGIIVNGKRVQVFDHKKPQFIPWYRARVDYVIESSGMFTTIAKASLHLEHGQRGSPGVRRVVVTAPSDDAPAIILGVNHHQLSADMKIISCATSTLYCLAPLVKLLDDHFGVGEGMITNVHAMTPPIKPLDGFCPKSKNRRVHRGALHNIIAVETGVCRMLGQLLPRLDGKLTGIAYCVPVVDVSVLDLTVRLKKSCTLSQIKKCIDQASQNYMKHIVRSSQEEAVSSDYLGDKHSCILDMLSSVALSEHFFKLVCWYDNEYSYACRIAEVIIYAENVRCLPLPMKKNYEIVHASQEHTILYDSFTSHSLGEKPASASPAIKAINKKQITLSPFRLKSLCMQEDPVCPSFSNVNNNKLHNAGKYLLNPENNCSYKFEKGGQLKKLLDRGINNNEFINNKTKVVTKIHKCKESDNWLTSLEFEKDENKTDKTPSNDGVSKSFDKLVSHGLNNTFVELKNKADSDIRSHGNISSNYMSSKKIFSDIKMDISVSVDLESLDFCRIHSRELRENDVTNQETQITPKDQSKLENPEFIFKHERNEFPELINESFIDEMLTVSYSADSTTFKGDDFVYYIGEPIRKRIMRNFHENLLPLHMVNGEKIRQKKYKRYSHSRINEKKVEDVLSYVNDSKIKVPSIDNIEINASKSQYSILNCYECINVPIQLNKTRTLQLCDKVDSCSDTDSSNSFQINEKKSIEIKMSDVTDSLEEVEKLDKICRILELSDDLSDNLFKNLDDENHKSRTATKRWSFKEFCESISFNDFFKSTFNGK